MGSLTALMNLSESALQASQTALDITSNNVANQNTVGYTREVATWQERDSISLSDNRSVGEGATVTAVSQRDRVLDQMVQQQTQLESSTSAQSAALTQFQATYGISSSSTSASSTAIGAAINSLFSSLSTLQASPANSSARQAVLSAAQTLASDFNSAASQILQQYASINQQVGGLVGQVNTLTASIAQLNVRIASTGSAQDAGTLEDQRQQDLTQLSQYIGFNQTKTENNGITLTTTNGAVMVSAGQSFALETATVNGNINVTASAAAGGQDITSGLTGGQLGGMLQARDRELVSAFASVDSLAYGIGTAVNAQNAAGVDLNGNPGGAIFNLPPTFSGATSLISLATNDPNAIAAAGAGEGASGSSNATALSGLQSAAIVNGQTAAAFYGSFLTRLGNTVSSASSSSTAQQASLTQLTTQQSSLSAVSLDEEAANLTQYQRSYEAAAKVFTIVDQLMASALNLGEETTVT